MNALVKLILLTSDEEHAHFCYVPSEVYVPFMAIKKEPLADTLSGWFYQDFGVHRDFRTILGIACAKKRIVEDCLEKCPALETREEGFDRWGFCRLWTTRHMKEALDATQNSSR